MVKRLQRRLQRGLQRKLQKGKKVKGYFTVEAAILFPFVMGVVLLVIYLLFFQYDRCLMEMSAAVLSMRGCTLQVTNAKDMVAEIARQGRKEDKVYVAWEMPEAKIQLKGNVVAVSREGNLKFPFRGLDFWNGGSSWSGEVSFQSHRIKPTIFIRNYRKWGGK